MRKLLIALLILSMIPTAALAAPQTIDLEAMSIEELQTLVTEASARIEELTPKPTPEPYKTYKKGDKGNDVKVIQDRLIELKYMIGKSDKSYGDKVVEAVKLFQEAAELEVTGIADSETQTALFSDDAMVNPEPLFDPSIYEKLSYKAIARDPEANEGKLIKFSGKIVQVQEGLLSNTLRIATRGSYDDVAYCTYYPKEGETRFLEDDKVTVYASCTGIETYETIMGGSVTIPSFLITRMELRK